jgi:ribosomal protein S18 acetylase RimI-like enzyme
LKNTQTLEIRSAKSADVAVLTELSHRTVLAKYPSVIGLEMVQGYVASGAVPAYYTDRLEHVWVAVLGGRPVGCYGLKDDAVDLMMVDVDFHRRGIGQALLAHAEAQLFERLETIFLDSFRENEQAVTFYKKHGWTEVTHFEDPDHGIPMVKLKKER